MVVLLGFLCIQFHSFSHINFDSLASDKRTQQTQNTDFSQIDEHSSFDEEVAIECAECVLTKHLQAGAEQTTVLFLDNSYKFVLSGTDNHLFEVTDFLFQLRAPPFYAV